MAGYSPVKITGMSSGLVQSREEFILPDDAYPTLENAYVWRERIRRKKGYQLLGRLQRQITITITLTAGSFNLITGIPLETTATIALGSISLVGDSDGSTYTDPAMNGILVATGGTGTGGTINYVSGLITINGGGTETLTGTINYFPGLPVMGIRTRELQNSAFDQTIFFDQIYAYIFNPNTNSFQEFIPGTTWNAHGGNVSATDFFWSTNYWSSNGTSPFTSPPGTKLFWETNNTGQFGGLADPPRITDGTIWVNWYTQAGATFTPQPWIRINTDPITTNPIYLVNWLSMLPFRGRMVVFNTWEGNNAIVAQNFSNRIRWSTIGNPFIAFTAGPPAAGSWRDDIRGQGGFLDIPTSEDIISIGFVRDNLVIYCERSTWQLRYTGRSIAPFQIERVNSELGGEGPFSAIQFDTSLVGIGDKGIVECDSYKSERIDIKIPDFIFEFLNENNGPFRVHGIRDFINRLAYWTIPYESGYDARINPVDQIFPNRRLVYNYENDSWALFTDSITTLGNYQPQSSRTWLNTPLRWIRCNFSWINSQPAQIPSIVAGNQQGFIEFLSNDITTNDVSLYISGITANVTSPTVITCPNHNLVSTSGTNSTKDIPYIIEISGIPIGTPFANLNGGIFGISVIDQNTFYLYTYDPDTQQFSAGQLDDFIVTITNITNAHPGVVTTSAPTTLVTGNEVTLYNVTGMTQVNGNTYVITVIDSTHFSIGVDTTTFGTYTGGGTVQFPYIGGGLINLRDNFSIISKKFNFLDEGQSIQMGYLDILMSASEPNNPGAITLQVYLDYNEDDTSNTLPKNQISNNSPTPIPDTFFNSTIPTTTSSLNSKGGTKFWQRVFCPTRANFLTLQYTFSNAQLAGQEQEQDIQIDAQVLWLRKGGRMTQI